MNTIKWGIIGTGNIANSFAEDFKFAKHGSIVAVASRSLERATAFSRKYHIEKAYGSYNELYNDEGIDAVYIATPHNLHFQNASDAMTYGKAVLCEKPMTISCQECKQLLEVVHSTSAYFMEAMWTYFLPPILKMQIWISEGKIGTIRNVKADFGFKANLDVNGRLFNPSLAGGALLDIGIYPIALTWLVFKKLPENVTVFHKKAITGVDSEETMIFEYPTGEIATLSASLLCDMPNEAIIIGDLGYIRIPDFFMARECFLYENDSLTEHFKDYRKSVGYNYEIDVMNQDLIMGKSESEIVPLETSLRLQELMELVKKRFDE